MKECKFCFQTNRWIAGLLVALLLVVPASAAPSEQDAPLGAYLGCFRASDVSSLPGVQGTEAQQFAAGTINRCPPACKADNYSLIIISPDFRCWCAVATPSVSSQLPGSDCASADAGAGQAAAVFYLHDLAATHKCRIVPTPLAPESVTVDYNQHNVEFSRDESNQSAVMRLQMQGNSGARVQPKCDRQLFGQFEVTAKVSSAPGVVTAFYARDSDWYNQDNSGDFEEIDFEFLNGNPGVPNSVWLNSYHRGQSRGETLLKPRQYQQLLGLSSAANNTNTWLTYTFSWQPSHVIWAMNGVPLQKKSTGELVKWFDMKGRPYKRKFASPDRPSHLSFSIWSDSSRFQFGGSLDYSKSPFHSYFKELRRIACEQAIKGSNDTQPWGPAWLYQGKATWKYDAEAPAASPSPPPAATETRVNASSAPPADAAVSSNKGSTPQMQQQQQQQSSPLPIASPPPQLSTLPSPPPSVAPAEPPAWWNVPALGTSNATHVDQEITELPPWIPGHNSNKATTNTAEPPKVAQGVNSHKQKPAAAGGVNGVARASGSAPSASDDSSHWQPIPTAPLQTQGTGTHNAESDGHSKLPKDAPSNKAAPLLAAKGAHSRNAGGEPATQAAGGNAAWTPAAASNAAAPAEDSAEAVKPHKSKWSASNATNHTTSTVGGNSKGSGPVTGKAASGRNGTADNRAAAGKADQRAAPNAAAYNAASSPAASKAGVGNAVHNATKGPARKRFRNNKAGAGDDGNKAASAADDHHAAPDDVGNKVPAGAAESKAAPGNAANKAATVVAAVSAPSPSGNAANTAAAPGKPTNGTAAAANQAGPLPGYLAVLSAAWADIINASAATAPSQHKAAGDHSSSTNSTVAAPNITLPNSGNGHTKKHNSKWGMLSQVFPKAWHAASDLMGRRGLQQKVKMDRQKLPQAAAQPLRSSGWGLWG